MREGTLSLRRRQPRSAVPKLVHQLLPAERPPRVAPRGVHERLRLGVAQIQTYVRVKGRPRPFSPGLFAHLNALHQPAHVGPRDRLVRECRQPHVPVCQRRRDAVRHAELPFEARARTVVDQRGERSGRHHDLDGPRGGHTLAVETPQLEGGVERAVRGVAAGVLLDADAGLEDKPRFAQPLQSPVRLDAVGAIQAPEPERRLDRGGVGCQAFSREQRRHHAVTCGDPRVQRFRHAPELLATTRRQRARDAERHRCLPFAQPEDSGGGSRGAQRPEGRGRMPATSVVSGAEHPSDAGLDLEASDIRERRSLPGRAGTLGQGDDGRHQRGAGMAHHRFADVVVVERVSRRSVDQRRFGRRRASSEAEQGRLRCRRKLPSVGRRDARAWLTGARQRHAERIEKGPSNLFSHGLGNVRGTQPGDESGEGGRGAHRARSHHVKAGSRYSPKTPRSTSQISPTVA